MNKNLVKAVSLWLLVAALILMMFPTSDPDGTLSVMGWVLLLAAVPVFFAAFANTVWYMLYRFGPEYEHEQEREKVKKERETQIYCRDCGKPLESRRSFKGHDTKTGSPIYEYSRRCPNWDTVYAKKRAMYAKSSLPLASMSMFEDYINCGERTDPNSFPQQHNHVNQYQTSTSCPSCIDQMLNDKAITEEIAVTLYQRAGITK